MGKCVGERIKLLFVRNKGSEEKKGEDIRRQNNREHKLEFFLFVRQLNCVRAPHVCILSLVNQFRVVPAFWFLHEIPTANQEQ